MNRIKEMIRREITTQQAIADKTGIRREYLNRIAHDKIRPSVYLGLRIAKALGTTVEDIFGGGKL